MVWCSWGALSNCSPEPVLGKTRALNAQYPEVVVPEKISKKKPIKKVRNFPLVGHNKYLSLKGCPDWLKLLVINEGDSKLLHLNLWSISFP